MPELKEPTFFATDLRPRFQQQVPEPESLEDYLALFAPARAEQRVGEASSLYLYSHDAAAAIAAAQPAARIVAILREPASFLRSLHLQLLQIHNETEKDLRAAMALEPARRRGERIPSSCARPQALLYSERVRYVEQLRRFHAVFAPEQVLTLIYDDFRDDNEATVRQVLRFLGVGCGSRGDRDANPSLRMRSQRAYEAVTRSRTGQGPVTRVRKEAIKAVVRQSVRSDGLDGAPSAVLHEEPDAADPALIGEMRRRYKGEVVALSEYLGRDLVRLWGYHKLA